MKKYWPIMLASFLGLIFGNLLFNSYEEETVMTSDGNVYMLQYGAYTDKEVLNEVLKKIDKSKYLVVLEDEIYYVYFAITTNYDNALMLKKLYNEQNIYLYIKNSYLGNSILIDDIKKLDQKISDSKKNEDITSYLQDGLVIYEKSR